MSRILERIEALFAVPGVYREGHFVLSSGLHSNIYFNKRRISGDPVLLLESAELLADLVAGFRPDVIISPEHGAVPFGRETAQVLTKRFGRKVWFIPAKKDDAGDFRIEEDQLRWLEGKRIVVVEDIFTTGTSTVKTLEAIYESGEGALAVAGLLDRSSGRAADALLGLPLLALKTVAANDWTFKQCRLEGPCLRGEPICTEENVGHGFDFVVKHGQPPYPE